MPLKKRKSLLYFFWVLAQFHKKTYEKEALPQLNEDINTALALLERDCTLWLGNITTHILRHIPEKIETNGPMYASWMFPFERMNSYLVRRANNKASMEQYIMETMQVRKFLC